MTPEDRSGSEQAGAGTQARVVAYLSQPEAHGGQPVEIVETHGAIVFLAGGTAIKMKRAVAFSYMNFSTPERRRRALDRELEINKPHAPLIYRDVVAVTQEPSGELALGGSGEPVEWVLRMRRFPEADLLSAQALRGPLDRHLMTALADAIAGFHKQAPVDTAAESVGQMRAIISDVGATMAGLPGLKGDADIFVPTARRALEECQETLAKRARAGLVRRCHGDLHLGNIVVMNGKPVLFDAIEFDEAIATVDTLYDLAFVLMDLCHRGDANAANVVMNRYLWRTGNSADLDGLAAMPLFLALRAAVRAMVTAQRARQEDIVAQGRDMARARSYLAAALGFLAPAPPRLVAVGGFSGTGKSTLAAGFAPLVGAPPGAVHLRSDLERKSLYGAEEADRLPADAYARGVTQKVYGILVEKALRVLAAGHAVVTDAVYAQPFERAAIEAAATAAGVPFTGLWLEAPREILLSRVAARRGDASDATPAVVEQQLGGDPGPLTWIRMPAHRAASETLAAARIHLHLTPEAR